MKKITHLVTLILLSVFFVSLNAQQTNTLCQPTVNASNSGYYGIHITNVTTSGAQTNLNNIGTGMETGTSSDFRSQVLSAYQGTSVTITVEPQGSNPSHIGVYIDTDNDGNYSASELVGSSTGAVGGSPATITFTVPSVNGDFNLRTILGYDTSSTYSFTDGCTMNNTLAGGLGESEDYTLRISDVPSCGPPTGLIAIAGPGSGSFSWNAGVNNDSYSWELFIGTETGATPYDSGTTTSTSDSTNYPLNGSTLYTVVLTASCTGTAVTPLSTTFTTPCDAEALPYSNSFETETPLTCFINSSTTPWQVGTAGASGIMPPSGSAGDYYVYFADYDYGAGSTADLVTPPLDMSSSTSATLTFDYIDPDTVGSAYNADTVRVYVIDASGNYNLVFTTDASVPEWTTQTVDLSSYAGQIFQIAFRGTSVYGYSNPSIDNLLVAEPSACPAPTITSASASSTTSASVEWTNDSTSSSNDVYVTTSTDSPDSLTAATITDATSPQSLTGLTANTTYYVYVRSQCTSGETSDWSSVSSFTTACEVATSGFSQNFNGLSALPSCWSAVNGGGSTTWGMHSSGAVFIGYESAAHDDYLKSPPFTVIDGVTDGFSFQASSPDLGYPEQIDVIVEDLTAGTSTIIADNYYPETPVASTVVYLSTFYDLSAYEGSDVRISFHST
ncbi:MAG: choice-of-anchor J domain-containing protein, partial [Bacteroidota bacterium]|nr:choice-of-anchor J domain-containing protein [Bacteroidota bacterium]